MLREFAGYCERDGEATLERLQGNGARRLMTNYFQWLQNDLGLKVSTTGLRFAILRRFCNWLVQHPDFEDFDRSPMAGLRKPCGQTRDGS